MRTHRVAGFLIFLAIWSQLDDALLAGCSFAPSGQLADEDDEYLSVEAEKGRKGSSIRQRPVFVPRKPGHADSFSGRTNRNTLFESKGGLTGPSLLYVFMSLQL
jgi:hypothetical protein